MNFLAPLFLLGAFAIAAPVIFHLIRRTTREKTRFSSLLFLKPDPPRLTQRSRIENWLLLLLRAAALALLALAFARPFLRTDTPPQNPEGPQRRMMLLVDRSASMRRDGLEEESRRRAEEIIKGAGPRDELALWVFDSGTKPLMDFAEWTAAPVENRMALAVGRLAETAPGWGGTALSEALMSAAGVLGESADGDESRKGGEIVLISDLQEGSRLEGLQGWEWPQEVKVTVLPVVPAAAGNAGLQPAPDLSGTGPAEEEPKARVRVSNAADSLTEQFQAGWAAAGETGFAGPAQDVYVPPGQSRVLLLPWPSGDKGSGEILLKGDAADFDNRVYVTPPATVEVKAFYFGAEDPADPKQSLFFLRQAMPQNRQLNVELTVVGPSDGLPALRSGEQAVFFASGTLPPAQADFLKTQAEEGRTVLLVLTTVEAGPALARIAGVDSVKLEEAHPANYAMFSEINFQHPLFAAFADPRFSDFTKIRFWNYRKLDAAVLPDARILTNYDSGDPAMVEVPVGSGRLVVLTAGWQPGDSQLALSSKFVPLLASLLEWSGAAVTPPALFVAGGPVDLTGLGFDKSAAVTVLFPDGRQEETVSGRLESATLPGRYTATTKETGFARSFAVNLEPAESGTRPLALDDLERLGVPVKTDAKQSEERENSKNPAPAVEAESRQKLWRWIIAAALAVLVLETLLAGLSARRATTSGETAA